MAKPLQTTPWLIFVLSYLVIPSLGQVPPGPAQITAPSLIVEGQSVTMTCSSTGGSPAPTVRWFKGDNEITTGVTTTSTLNTVTATLVFTAAKADHYAVYECQVDNGVLQNPLKDTEFVFVNYPPDPPTLTGPTTLTAGDPGVWTCFSNDGYPAGVMTMKNQNTNTQFPGSQFTSASTADGFGFDVTGTLNWTPALANNGHTICCNVAHDTTLGAGNPQEVCLTLTINAPLAVNAPVTSYTPTIGNSVTLQCVVTSGTATSITWLKEGQALTISSNNRLSGGSPTTPSLTISNVQSSDGGNYVCRAANAVSTVNTNTINLNPQGTPPVVTIPLPNYSQTYGQSITIACQVSSPNSPLQEVQWTFTNSNSQVTDPIVIGTGKYSGSTAASPSLTINNLVFTDEGVYRCRARNLIGTSSSATTATLDVQGTPPTANIPQNSYSAVYGDQLVITCNVNNANPAVTSVVWQKTTNGATTTINSGDSGYQGSTPTTPSLTINFVTQNSAGTYTCRATNVVDTGISNPTTVTITGGILTVSQSPNSANVLGGSTTTITCTASGQPAANGVSWLFTPTGGTQQTLTLTNRYSGAQPTNPSLTISNFQQSDAGTYVCRVSNVAGQATSPTTTVLTYIEQLTININPSDPVNIVGDPSRQITCSISGTPQAFTVNWYRRPINGGTRTQITSSSKYTLVSSFTSPVLTINNIQETDEQDYFCEATNTAGTVTSSRSRLTVNGGLNTISISPANQDVIQGTNQLITCTVSGQPNPTSIRWFFTPNGGSQQQLFIANSNGKYSGGTTTNPSMTVNNFQSGDAGTYFCQAINAAGTATSSNSVLNYLGILSVTVTPASQTAIIGDASATVACQVSGSPQATDWSWTKTVPGGNTEVIQRGTNNGKIQVANSATNPNLIISNIVQSDEANYVCRATNGAGQQVSSSSFLDVQGTAPSINIEPSSQQAVIGDTSAIFQCTVTATPQATTWSWTFNPADGSNPVTIGQGTDNTQYLVDNSASRPHLTIRTIVASDAGTYSCTATNTVGTQTSQPATLTVTGAVLTVTISPSSANVVRGNTQQIQCTINGFPTAQGIQWFFTPSGSTQAQSVTISGRFSGGTVGNPHLTITNFQSGDAGTYRCAATNAAGTGTSGNSVLTYVEFLVVTTSPSDSSAVIGDASATIQCTITGVPAATSWSWTRRPLNGNVGTAEDVTAGAKYTIANSASNPNLVINNIAEDDERDYYCHATNLAGNVISSVRARLIVNGDLLSVSISPSADNVLMGTNKDVTCTVNGIPAATNIIWYFTPPNGAEQTLTLTPAKYTGGTTTNPSITILNFQQSDGGTYVCAAQNAVGLQRSLTSVLTYMEQLTISVSPADGVRLYGDASHTIQCSISGTPAPFSTSWSYRPINGGTLQQISPSAKYSIASSNTAPHLTINNIIESDERDYFCQASNIAGTQVSTRARLIVNGALLTVVVSPSSQNVQIGTTQTITCDITGDPSVTEVQWRFSPSTGGNPRIINVGTSNGKYTGGSINNYDLTVTNFQSSDSGNYVCQATNAVGQANSNPSTLTFVQLLTVTVSPADNSVEYGTNQVVIDCVISGTPDATSYSWTRRPIDGLANTAVDISTGTKYTISNSNTRPTLTIMNIVEADEQDYYCSATNIVGTTTSSRARLIVTGDLLTVDISPAQANVIRGNTQVISCQVTGTPSVTLVSWTKDGTNINIGGTQGKYSGGTPGNPSLTITNFQSTDAGTYVCTATNAVGPKSSSNSVLTYIENLSLTVSPAQGSAILGTSQYVISCAITGSPLATSWKWVKNPGNANAETIVMGTNSNKYLVANSATNPSLTIKNIAQSDDANYRCEAENVAGTRQSTNARLIVTGQLPAITVTPLQQFPQYGASSLMISCTVQASPSADTVGWRKNSVDGTSSQVINAANSNGKYVITNSLTNPDLQINNIDFTDDANYQCFATNAVGTGESALARVDVTGSSPQVSIPSSSYSGIYGNNIEIPCTINGANPTHTQVNWYRVGTNNQLTTININDPSQYLGGTVANPALTIIAADNNDSGLYRCSATNVVGTGESLNTQITVLGGVPVVQLSKTTEAVELGATVTLVCTISTQVPAVSDVFWQFTRNTQTTQLVIATSQGKYSGSTVNNPSLTITNASYNDEGSYQCFAQNIVGIGQSDQLILGISGDVPAVTLSRSYDTVVYGMAQITVDCIVSSPIYPLLNVFWQKTNQAGVTTQLNVVDSNGKYLGSTISNPGLTINSLVYTDSGTYVCFAENRLGVGQSSSYQLEVGASLLTVNVPTSTYTVLLGNQVSMVCTVTGTPSATDVWWEYRANNNQNWNRVDTGSNNRYSGGVLGTPTITITNAAFSDEGEYRCRGTNAAGTATSITATLDVTGTIPTVTIGSPNYSIDFGQSITLVCTVQASPPYSSVSWTKTSTGGTPSNVDLGNTAKYSGSAVGTPSLTITSANLNDEGTYVCSASNSVGTGSSMGTVLDVVGGLLTVTVTQRSYSVQLGESVTLGCTWSGVPPADFVTWQKVINNVPTDINVGGSNGKYVGSTATSPSLSITLASDSDKAEYICTATNGVGRAFSQRTSLDVTGAPPQVQILKNSYSVNYGSSITLECTVTAIPSHTEVQWRKSSGGTTTEIDVTNSGGKYGGATVNTPSLVVNNANLSDEGNYVCAATNQLGTGTSSSTVLDVVGGLLTVTIPPDTYTVQVGNSITIPCIVSGLPPANQIQWRKIQNAIVTDINIANSGGKYFGSIVATPELTINNVQKSDSANYQCTATNVEGKSNSNQVFLTVTGNIPIVEIPADTYTVEYGGSITIPCTVNAVPAHTRVQWKRFVQGNLQDIDIQGSGGKYSGSSVAAPSLMVNNVNQGDETSYICTATNDVGTGQSFARFLDVVGGLLTVTIPSNQYSVQAGQNIQIECIVSGTPSATSVLWKKFPVGSTLNEAEDVDVANSNGHYTGSTTTTPSLSISNAGDSDEANYVCTATNTAGTTQSQITNLNVIGTIPSVVIPNPTHSVGYGQTVTIQCQITATPSVTSVLWTKTTNGVETTINVANSNGKYIGGTVTTPSLTITNANIQNDEANYVCSATNSLGTGRSTSAFLDVIGGLLTVNAPQNIYTVQQGNSVQMICTWSGTPSATSVVWKKYVLGNPVDIDTASSNGKYSGSTVDSPSLTINNVAIEDDTTYVCSATNLEGTSSSRPVNLDVTGALPNVRILKPVYTVNHGNFITLECTVTSNPEASSVQWFKIVNGNSVTLDISGVNRYSGGTVTNPSLTISSVMTGDEGNYVCAASNAIGTSQSSQTFLDVLGDILMVVIPVTQYNYDFGSEATLECQVSGSPALTNVYWTKSVAGSSAETIDMTNTNKYGGSTINNPSLVIKNSNDADEGSYTCWATNAVGTAQSSATNLNIDGNPPTVTLTSTLFPVLVGNEIILGCNVISNPAHSNVYWIFTNTAGQTSTITSSSNPAKYGGITLASPSLTLRNADFADEGTYVCYAQNSIGTSNSQTATVDVSGQPPNVNIPLPSYAVDFGQSVTLTCTVTANPAHTNVYWRKLRNGITTDINVANSGNKYTGSTVGIPSLTINNAALDDQGSYTCFAVNSVGTGQSSQTALTVSGNIPIVSVDQSQYVVDYGNTVTLGCTVTATPTHTSVYWQKIQGGTTTTIDAAVINNDPGLSGATVANPDLVISNVNLDDGAAYICFAQNSVGTGQSSQTQLVISGAAPQAAVLSNSYNVVVGNTITLQCVVTSNPPHTSVQWQHNVNGQNQNVDVAGNNRLTGSTVSGPSLTISQAQFSDEGTYICTATNAIGTGSSTQTFLDVTGTTPVVTVSQTEFQGDFGQSATLVCTVSANPAETRVYWKKLMSNGNLQEIDTTNSRYSGSTIGSPSLVISNLNRGDQAFYQCFADNSIGTGSSAQTFLRVIGDIPSVSVPTTHTFTLGTTAVLQCTVSANPAVTSVSWAKYNAQNQLVNIDMTTNNNNKYQGSTVGSPSLTILNTAAADEGRYVCTATNAVGTGQSGTTTLDITGAIPVVNIPQNQYTVGYANQITIACSVSATPQETSIYWTKQVSGGTEQTITKTNSAKYQGQTVNSPALTILNADFTDSATYYCYATNNVGTGKSNPTVLSVTGNIPNVQIPLTGYSVNYGNTATIPCTVSAAPSATSVQWKKLVNGQEQDVDLSSSKYSGSTVQSPALVISNAVTSDETFYFCTATNTVGTGRSSQTYLDVVGASPVVNVGATSYTVQTNQNIELVCTITANPAATSVQWFRFDGAVQSNLRNIAGKYNSPTVNSPNLVINNADNQDRGYYICTASNIVGTGTSPSTFVDVTGNIPVVTVSLSSFNGNYGATVTLGCNIIANPAATTVYWTKTVGSTTTNINTPTNKYSFSLNSPSLVISNLGSDDEANYRCHATNSVGTGSSQPTFLDIIGSIPSVTVSAQSVDVNIGNSGTLTCSVQANPAITNVYWQILDANNQATTINIDGNKYTGSTVSNPSLTVSNAQLSDRANYICFATNDVGTGQSGTAFLNVIGNPPVVNIPQTSYTVPWGNQISLVCSVTSIPAHSSVQWKRIQNGVETVLDINGNSAKYEGGSVNSPTLIIKNANRNTDQAFYECSATNSIGTGTSSRTFLSVTGNIPTVSIPNNYQVEIGQNIVIPCTITSNPAHTSVQWQRQDANGARTNLDVSDQSQYNNGNMNNPSLTILGASNSDEGWYICTATNAVGTGSSAIRYLDVTGNILQVTVPQNIYNVNYGQSIQLICSVTGSPSATQVYWTKVVNGVSTEIRASTMDTNKYSGVTLGNPSLTVLNANSADSAVYKCYAENIVGRGESQQTQLNVIGNVPQVTVGSSAYNVNLGNPIILQCTVIATPSATAVRWNKVSASGTLTAIDVTNNPSKYSGGSLSVPSLTIYNAQNSDQSSYTCQATNAVGTTVSSPTTLTVVGNIPVVTIGEAQYSATIGENVVIQCTINANPAHTQVFWRKATTGNFVDIPANSRYTGMTVSSPSLVISNLQSSDAGAYKCYATNSVGTGESAQTFLSVVGSIPVVNVQTTQYSVNIGNSITLQCQVSSNPIHTSVLWQRVDANGIATDVDMTNSRYSGSMVTAPSLIISNAMLSDQGRYKCLATNAVGTGQSQQTFLTVIGSIPTVNVPQPQYSANTGSTVTLQCSYSANPTATQVRWQKDGVDIGDTSTTNKYGGSTLSSPSLIIYDAQESDEGSYTCRVTNSVGTGTSTSTQLTVVGNVPVVTVPQPTYTVDVGGSVTLTCQVTSDPAHSNVFWRKVTGGTETDINTNAVKYSGSTVNTPSLTISNAAFGDSGTYYCYATNSVGTGQSTGVVLSVTGTTPSVTLTQTNINANYGTDVTIGCVVSANPAATNVYWQKVTGANNAAVTIDMTNTAKYADGSVTSPSLRILNVDTSDQARYICYAVNSVGTGQSQQGTLNVIGSPPTVTFPQLTYTTNIGNTVTLVCNIVANPDYSSIYWTKTIGAGTPEQISTTGSTSTKYSGATVGAPNLIIYNVQPTDAGQYNCFATNVVGSGNGNQPVTLQVVGNPPTVTATIPSSAAVGTSVTITCSIDANPAVTSIIWQYITNNNANNIDIINNNRYSGGTLSTPSLTISPVQENDEGSYRCQATNTEGTGTSNQVFLDTTGDPPVNVAVTPNPITVQQGQTITATCSSSANPPASYEWRVFGTTTVIQTGPTLTISNADTTNANRYVCRAYNSFGSGEASTNVDVQHRPIVTLTDIPVTGSLGQSATINCQFTSNPFADNVQWKKLIGGVETNVNIDGNKYQGGTRSSPSLTILNLNGGDQAEYVCVVTNSVGTGRSQNGQLIVDLRTSPMGINIYPGQITVLEGNSFSIYCNATANPSPSYEWYHDDTKVGTGQTYTVTNSVWGPHDGLYTCKAFNVIGDQQATIDVDVKYPPVSAVTENTFTPTLNSGITLTCNTNANPSSISWKWFQNGYEMTDQTEKALYLDMDSAGDAGNYYCIAYNEVGQSAQIFFTVTVDTGATTTLIPATGAAVASAGGLTGGEIAAICLGILFFILLLIVLAVCCVLQGCCAWCCGAGAAEKDRRVTPDGKVDIPRFYEVPTVVTREPSLISKRDVSLHMAPAYRPQNDYEITKYRVVRPEYDVGEYVTTSSVRPYYLPPIEYTYDEAEERRRRRRKKKKSRRHEEMRDDQHIVLEERVVGGDVYTTTSRAEGVEVGPDFYFEDEN